MEILFRTNSMVLHQLYRKHDKSIYGYKARPLFKYMYCLSVDIQTMIYLISLEIRLHKFQRRKENLIQPFDSFYRDDWWFHSIFSGAHTISRQPTYPSFYISAPHIAKSKLYTHRIAISYMTGGSRRVWVKNWILSCVVNYLYTCDVCISMWNYMEWRKKFRLKICRNRTKNPSGCTKKVTRR